MQLIVPPLMLQGSAAGACAQLRDEVERSIKAAHVEVQSAMALVESKSVARPHNAPLASARPLPCVRAGACCGDDSHDEHMPCVAPQALETIRRGLAEEEV